MIPKQILQNFFGYSDFRSGQEEIINAILNEENVLAVLPTGAGKSLCYQIPSLLSGTFALVISPLIALMKDQVDSLNARENISAYINSSLDYRLSENVLNSIPTGKIKILYVSPEKLGNKYFADKLISLNPSFLFIDEAHCISEWGHNFRPAYRKIKEFIDLSGIKKISAFTATATEEVRTDIINQLGIKNPKIFVHGFERNNFSLNVIHTSHKKEFCTKILKDNSTSVIIYASTRKATEEITEHLRINNIKAAYYHAGLTPELRRIIQDDFTSGRVKTIVATNAFGMGIDKSNIRIIIHFNMPGSIENYYQEIGRAGRDGQDSNIYLLYDEKDKIIHEYFISTSTPNRLQLENVYETICNCGNVALGTLPGKNISLNQNFFSLLGKKDLTAGLINTSLKILEDSGYIRIISETGNKHYGQFLLEPQHLNSFLKNFPDNELKDIILLLVREYGSKIFKSKSSINIQKLSEVFNISPPDVVNQLGEISNAGIFIYEEPVLNPTVSLLKNRIYSKELALNTKHIDAVAKNSKLKLDKMISYAYTDQCRFKFILDYFGQPNKDYKCGKCDICMGTIGTSKTSEEYLEEIILQTIHEAKIPIKLKPLINILRGTADLPSLKKFSTFGSCIHFNKDEITNALNKNVHYGLLIISNGVISLHDKGINKFLSDETKIKSLNQEYENDLMLFNRLKQIRKETAIKFNQSAKIICPDEILRTIATNKPQTRQELIKINGFNDRMFNKAGEEFLSTIKDFCNSKEINNRINQKKLDQNIIEVLELVQKRYSLGDIASLTKLPEAIVSTQIVTLLEAIPELEIDYMFDKNELDKIYTQIEGGILGLKEIYEALNKSIAYSKIRIASAKKRITG